MRARRLWFDNWIFGGTGRLIEKRYRSPQRDALINIRFFHDMKSIDPIPVILIECHILQPTLRGQLH
jgi:hypothetical protein